MSDREANDLWFGYPETDANAYDERGDFAVREVFLDGVDRTWMRFVSLRHALDEADRHRSQLKRQGYDRHRVHVGVIDSDDPERGELDWDTLDTPPSRPATAMLPIYDDDETA